MKKIILFSIALFALGMVGCSSDEKEGVEEDILKPIKLDLNTLNIEPFGRILVKIGVSEEEVWNYYDSIQWYVNGFAYSWFNPYDDETVNLQLNVYHLQ